MAGFDGRLLAAQRRDGLLTRDDALAQVVERFGVPGGPGPAHVLDARVAGGFHVEVLPGRGMDLGHVWIDGVPLSWRSPVADARPLDVPRGTAWADRFIGGLLTTCGPHHVGPPTERHGMHGTASHAPGRVTRAESEATENGGRFVVEGVVEHAALFGPSLVLHRRITGDLDDLGRPRLTVEDRWRNEGPGSAPVRLLLHLNLGAPLVAPGTTVEVAAEGVIAREAEPVARPDVMGPPREALEEAVFQHRRPRHDGGAPVVVRSPLGPALHIGWSGGTLPHLYEWVLPTRGRWALGIEPSNARLFDAAEADDAEPLAAGGELRTAVHFIWERGRS